jgi:hypothetical protein
MLMVFLRHHSQRNLMTIRPHIAALIALAVLTPLIAIPAGASSIKPKCAASVIKSHYTDKPPKMVEGFPSKTVVLKLDKWVTKADEKETFVAFEFNPPKVKLGTIKNEFDTLGVDNLNLLLDSAKYAKHPSAKLKATIMTFYRDVETVDVVAAKDLNRDLSRALAACKD